MTETYKSWYDSADRFRVSTQSRVVDPDTGEIHVEDSDPQEFWKDSFWIPEMEGVYILAMGATGPDRVRLVDYGTEIDRRSYNHYSSNFFQGLYSISGQYLQNDLTVDRISKVEAGELEGQASVIIEAELPDGYLTLWLSPEEGYTMQKWRLVSEVGVHRTPSEVEQPSHAEKSGAATERRVVEYTFYDRQDIEGFNVPMELKKLSWIEYGDEKEIMSDETSRLTNLQFNPDFDALGVFAMPDYSNVSEISLIKPDLTVIKNLVWNNGDFYVLPEVVDVERQLDEGTESLKGTRTTEEEKTPDRLSLNLGEKQQGDGFKISGTAQLPVIAALAAFFLLLALAALVWHFRKKTTREGESRE
ncbi:MAG: hypothetical protein GX130_05565 [Candidatus Hydrogenedens sp.]|nr:hypothetical protein [Candidatus Hydrogenedens sp.]